jgi:hypothetical protein
MSLSRLLRSEKLARKTAPREIELSFEEAVRLANKDRKIIWDPLPPPEAPTEPMPAVPPTVEAKAVPPQPQPPRQWWEERCRWRERTTADNARDAENNDELDDPLGIYS